MFKNKETWQSWSSWSSPVGLGIYFLTTAIAIAVIVYTLISLAGIVIGATRPAPSYEAYPTSQDVPSGALMPSTGQ